MAPRVVIGGASQALGRRICAELGVDDVPVLRSRFPDGEIDVAVCGALGGGDVFIVQSTSPPVEEHLVELLLLTDACTRLGAARVTAVIPYFGYARHDRRDAPGAPVGIRVVCDALRSAGVDRAVVVDPHVATLEAVTGFPLDRVSAVRALAERAGCTDGTVVVAPDLGAAKLAGRYARVLRAPTAVVVKERLSGSEVTAHRVLGEVANRRPVVIDDMISTAGTVVAAVDALARAGADASTVTVIASHGVFTGPALQRLATLGPDTRVFTTDTVEPPDDEPALVVRVSVAAQLADTIRALHEGLPLDGIAVYG